MRYDNEEVPLTLALAIADISMHCWLSSYFNTALLYLMLALIVDVRELILRVMIGYCIE